MNQHFDLPPELQVFFKLRDIGWLEPVEKQKCRKMDPVLNGYLNFSEKVDPEEPPEKIHIESRLERKRRFLQEREEKHRQQIKDALAEWNPFEKEGKEEFTTDPFKTLFVARLSFETNEKKLRKEFEPYGEIKNVIIPKDIKTDKPRGYAFIEFERTEDLKNAYKHCDGKKIDGRRVLVDIERGRTISDWRPRRLGGGLGDVRVKKIEIPQPAPEKEGEASQDKRNLRDRR